MTADALTLAQWLSPSFPASAFAYSHGLETAIQDGRIQSASDLQTWLADVIEHGSGRCDCILLRAAFPCDGLAALHKVDATAIAFAPAAARLRERQLRGAAFSATVAAIWPGDQPALTHPVAVGWAARRLGIDLALTAAMSLQFTTSNLVSVAGRLVPLGQTQGQAVLAALTPLCQAMADATENAILDDLHSTAFMSDIAATRHETLEHRIFRSNPNERPLRLGIGGPVGAGKTTLTTAIARALHPQISLAVITDDIYTQEDAEALTRMQILPQNSITGVETGGCPHTAICEDASINLAAIAEMRKHHPGLKLVIIESGGDNLSATFSPELADLTNYVVDVAAG